MVCNSCYNSVTRVADPTIALGNGYAISRTKLLSKSRLLTLRRRKVMKLSAEQKFRPFPPNCLSVNYKVLLQCRECEQCETVAGTLLFESSQIGFLGMKFHKFCSKRTSESSIWISIIYQKSGVQNLPMSKGQKLRLLIGFSLL